MTFAFTTHANVDVTTTDKLHATPLWWRRTTVKKGEPGWLGFPLSLNAYPSEQFS